ncbi:bifunctional folylpolyglutamate synthase/dihydrofolate synthase [Flavobacterium silvaticum]|uniref:Dihydrofolate synthase/folylpolyglutamate synthase n=1 Tax=Flavobacterium silvaticum TaxID=1852020 RepID=A0A972FUP1_9FLAO|nr:folylpolyglutamate synthase/dihydrofolate synthase family protein [Flavobacterium silvaticum]NMH29659.1 bifunctional folylpolyglutamate synthase/dihydrofolate synthase [Flavobacterium silvaticum]
MDYQQTLDWMFAQLPMYQTQGASAFRKDLDNIKLLCSYLDHPEDKLKCIHVAGTNGKGSTCHLLASVFQQAGYKTGLFTSPHLKDYRERIRINGITISEEFVIDFIAKHKDFFERNNLSFFEMSVGLCFMYFLEENIDIAIIETGLGGRLDATNVVHPLVSVITNIGFDHTQYLGNTLESIAREKAGIIKPETPVVIGEYTAETKPVFEFTALEKDCEILFAQDMILPDFPSDLTGDYQFQNKRTVLACLQIIEKYTQFRISDDAIKTGFLKVSDSTGLLGRWQIIGQNPLVVADTAHNSHGFHRVMTQIENQSYQKLHLVIGMVNDKNLDELLPLFPKDAIYYFCKPQIPRRMETDVLADAAEIYGLRGKRFDSVPDAYEAAKQASSENDMIYIGGSTFVVAEILQ